MVSSGIHIPLSNHQAVCLSPTLVVSPPTNLAQTRVLLQKAFTHPLCTRGSSDILTLSSCLHFPSARLAKVARQTTSINTSRPHRRHGTGRQLYCISPGTHPVSLGRGPGAIRRHSRGVRTGELPISRTSRTFFLLANGLCRPPLSECAVLPSSIKQSTWCRMYLAGLRFLPLPPPPPPAPPLNFPGLRLQGFARD